MKTVNKKAITLISIVALVLIAGISILIANLIKEPLPGLYNNNKLVENPEIMSVNGEQIDIQLYRYFFKSAYDSKLLTDEKFLATDEDRDEFMKSVDELVKSNLVIKQLYKNYDIALSDEDNNYLDNLLLQEKSKFPTNVLYQNYLKELYLTEDIVRELYADELLNAYLIDELIGDEVRDSIIRARHILITLPQKPVENEDTTEEENKTALETYEKEKQEALKKAEEISKRLDDGEDFETLLEEYNQDLYQPKEGYYFVDGEIFDEFYDAVTKLENDEISGIVESPVAYHIIKRLEPDSEYLKELTPSEIYQKASNSTELSTMYTDIVTPILDKAEIIYGKDYNLVNENTIK